jgi:hypothetical protein
MNEKPASLSDILHNLDEATEAMKTELPATDYVPVNKKKILGYPPPRKPYHQTVEEELDKAVDEVLIQEPLPSTTSIVEEHFLKQGEAIAFAMEEQARIHTNKAESYSKLAQDAREAAKIQAKTAAAHEDRMKQIETLLDQQE